MNSKLYERIIKDAPMAYAYCTLVYDQAGKPESFRIDDVNNSFELMTGFSFSDISHISKGGTFSCLDADFDSLHFFSSVAASRQYRITEVKSRCGNHWYRIIAYPLGEASFVAMFCDITAELLSLERKSLLIHATNDVILEFDSDNRISEIYTLVDSEAHCALGKRLDELFDQDFASVVNAALNRVRDTGEREFVSFPSPFPGDLRYFRADIRPWNGSTLLVLNDITREHEDQEKIQQLSEQLEEFFFMSLDLLAILDTDGRFIRVNRVWKDMLGYSSEEMKGKLFLEFLHTEDVEASRAAYRELLEIGELTLFANRYRTKSGEYRVLEWRAAADGSSVYAAARDVTEKIDLQRSLEEERDFSRTVIDTIPEAVAVTSAGGRIHHVNEAFAKMVNTSFSKLIGKPLGNFIEGDPIIPGTASRKLHLASIPVAAASAPMYRHDLGSGAVTVFTDISRITRAEEKLHRRADFEKLLLDLSSELFTCSEQTLNGSLLNTLQALGSFSNSDRSYLFQFDDESFSSMSNTHEWCSSSAEPQMEDLKNLSVDLFPEISRKVLCGEEVYIPDVSALKDRCEDSWKHLVSQDIGSLLVIPIESGGRQFGFFGFDSAVGQMKWDEDERAMLVFFSQTIGEVLSRLERERALQESLEREQRYALETERMNREISSFVAKMSHEVRTAVNSITGINRMLLDTDLNEQQARYAGIIRSSSRLLLNLVRDVLDFSRIESGKAEIRNTVFIFRKVMADCINPFRNMAVEKGLTISCSCSPAVPLMLIGDPAHICQTVSNLVSNAVKYTDEGTITITTRIEDYGKETVLLEICVKDTGPGIPFEDQQKIFEPYYQVDSANESVFGGTGLGLPICRSLAEQMGGSLSMNSSPGNGTLMRLRLPLGLCMGPDGESSPTSGEYSLVSAILMDQETETSQALASLMSSWGMKVNRVSTEEELLECSRESEVSVVLLCMEDVSPDTAAAYRNIPGKRILYLISANYDEQLLQDFEMKGSVNGFFMKPVNPRMLAETIKDDLGFMPHVHERKPREVLESIDRIKVLVVEDIKINQEVVLYLLYQVGFTVDIAETGERAVQMASSGTYDLVLMDLKLPDMSGVEAAKRIRNLGDPVKSAVPVIALTANVIKGEQQKCLDAGMNDFVVKPIQSDDLYEAMFSCLPAAREEAKRPRKIRGDVRC